MAQTIFFIPTPWVCFRQKKLRSCFRLPLARANRVARSICWGRLTQALQMQDLHILSGDQSEFHVVERRLAEKWHGIARESERLQRQAKPGCVHLIVGVHVLGWLDGIK